MEDVESADAPYRVRWPSLRLPPSEQMGERKLQTHSSQRALQRVGVAKGVWYKVGVASALIAALRVQSNQLCRNYFGCHFWTRQILAKERQPQRGRGQLPSGLLSIVSRALSAPGRVCAGRSKRRSSERIAKEGQGREKNRVSIVR